MLMPDGCVAHIDFGFLFDTAPGGGFTMERAPFKLTGMDIKLFGGENGMLYQMFKLRFR